MSTSVKQRVSELKQLQGSLPKHIYNQRKRSVLTALKRLAPGGSADVAAIKDDKGVVHTDSVGISEVAEAALAVGVCSQGHRPIPEVELAPLRPPSI